MTGLGTGVRAWFDAHTSHSDDWPAARLLARKRDGGHRISVVIPARDEERSVGDVVASVRRSLVEEVPLVDELVVIDSDSADGTAEVARRAGARVEASAAIAATTGTHPGKGEAIWKSLFVTSGDLLVFIDADLTLWGPHFVTGLLGPLLEDPATLLVKGFYDRLLNAGGGAAGTSEGGRVTELVARPLINLWRPDLAGVVQPLAGEWAVRRSLMESVAVPTAYGVELAVLLDTERRHGLEAIAQVDLGARAHEHQKVHDLALMAAELLAVAERHRGRGAPPATSLHQPVRRAGATVWRSRAVPLHERPPASDVPEYGGAGRRVGGGS